MSLAWIRSQQSFLSPEVKTLLQKAILVSNDQVDSSDTQSWLNEDCTIAFGKLEEVLSDIVEEYESKEWFSEAVVKLAPLFSHCHNVIRKLTLDDYSTILHPYLQWTHKGAEICTCLEEISEGSCSSDHLVGLLTITAITERALGNLVLMKREQVPFLLRDLLATPELLTLLGNTRITLLKILLGSVLGINLRNIAWHGFLSPCEANPAFVASIIIILADCGRFLKDCKITNVPCRPFVSFKEACCLSSIFENVSFPPRIIMEELIIKSPLVPAIMIPAWMKALDLLTAKRWGSTLTVLLPIMECSLRCLFAYANEMPKRVLTAENSTLYITLNEILDPCICESNYDFVEYGKLNQSTKKSYASINLLCRINENNTSAPFKHGTVSHISASARKLSNTNHTLLIIGKKLNEALQDLLNFVQGPRVRDRISHGEVQLEELPQNIAQSTMYLCLLVLSLGSWRSKMQRTSTCSQMKCSHYNIDCVNLVDPVTDDLYCYLKDMYIKRDTDDNEIKKCTNSMLESLSVIEASENLIVLLTKLSGCIEKYKSIYHPSAILQDQLVSSVSQLKNWLTWERVDFEELGYDDWKNKNSSELPEMVSIPSVDSKHEVKSLDQIKDFLSHICNVSYEVLYRPKPELEVVSVLQRVASSVQSALANICKSLSIRYVQYINKKLRSRQRETYRRQLNAIPAIVLNIYLALQIIYVVFFSINRVSYLSKPCFTNLLSVLKSMLKFQENIASQTNLNTNRWDEALSLSLKSITTIKKYFSG
ncbi:endoplasmic reticulum membrane-associated RNA degradation protein [Procambarus clarkii]|uniref:endoplasmic reticulum membrane-associated RNA degradation protein n=1 Tax=Procambarus clarkii TaxID=6728 RepID=UPI001E6718C3|nr:endoplasmic reticulum membrane-associated RNA degradation protein-like [Procambarus clarkii]XP_045592124.1 endoplasmic reticulum membrane-associated RNA degradation protein-like [Procambarus clarkii]